MITSSFHRIGTPQWANEQYARYMGYPNPEQWVPSETYPWYPFDPALPANPLQGPWPAPRPSDQPHPECEPVTIPQAGYHLDLGFLGLGTSTQEEISPRAAFSANRFYWGPDDFPPPAPQPPSPPGLLAEVLSQVPWGRNYFAGDTR